MNIILIALLILLIAVAFYFSPTIGHYPMSGLSIVLVVVVLLVAFGRI